MSWSCNGRAGVQPGSGCPARTARAAGPSWSRSRSRRRRPSAADQARAVRRARLAFVRRRPAVPARWRALFFFERLRVAVEAAPNRARGKPFAVTPLQMFGNLNQRHIGLAGDQPKDLRGMRLDPVRPRVAALRAGCAGAGVAPAAHPLHRSGGRNAETIRSRPAGHAAANSGDQSGPKVVRQRFGHAGWPPLPAPSMNHCSRTMGIPYRFCQVGKCSKAPTAESERGCFAFFVGPRLLSVERTSPMAKRL